MPASLPSHTLKVTGVSPELLQRLDRRIKQRHATGRAAYIRELIQKDVLAASEVTFRQILEPIHRDTRALPDTETSLDAFFEAERETAFQEHQPLSPR